MFVQMLRAIVTLFPEFLALRVVFEKKNIPLGAAVLLLTVIGLPNDVDVPCLVQSHRGGTLAVMSRAVIALLPEPFASGGVFERDAVHVLLFRLYKPADVDVPGAVG